MGHLVLVLGGARSGKSAHAESRAAALAGPNPVLYVATAQGLDDEMISRIARHQSTRPSSWRTLEEPLNLGQAIERACLVEPQPTVVLVDCVTIWLSNLLAGSGYDADAIPNDEVASQIAHTAVDRLLDAHRGGSAHTILVSNEVGMGLVPPYLLGRVYRDTLGRMNMWLASAADEVTLMVAGLPVCIKAP